MKWLINVINRQRNQIQAPHFIFQVIVFVFEIHWITIKANLYAQRHRLIKNFIFSLSYFSNEQYQRDHF